jgi:hypothetical protein
MNERLEELSSQARDIAREYVADCEKYGHYMEHNEYDLQFESKFAELIVLECIPFVGDPDSVKVKQMLEHFGVDP